MKKICWVIVFCVILFFSIVFYSSKAFAYQPEWDRLAMRDDFAIQRSYWPPAPNPQPNYNPTPVYPQPTPQYYGNATGWLLTNEGQWKYALNGNWVVNNWVQVNNYWYFLDTNGYMITGWWKIGDGYFYLNQVANAKYPVGACYINDITPDGRKVDSRGALCP